MRSRKKYGSVILQANILTQWVRQNTYIMLIKQHRKETHNIQKAEMVGVGKNLIAEDLIVERVI